MRWCDSFQAAETAMASSGDAISLSRFFSWAAIASWSGFRAARFCLRVGLGLV